MLSEFLLVELEKTSKFDRGYLLSHSLRIQKTMLASAKFFLSYGNIGAAREQLALWKKERASFKVLAKLNARKVVL